ncbi:UNVERIFIED_CONTAM: hypothetical protein ABIE34_002766 [Jeotgalibacillus campisalis]
MTPARPSPAAPSARKLAVGPRSWGPNGGPATRWRGVIGPFFDAARCVANHDLPVSGRGIVRYCRSMRAILLLI